MHKLGLFGPNSINFLILTKFHMFPCYKGADFKSDIHFRKCRAHTPKFTHFEPKDIHFLILTKFCLSLFDTTLINFFFMINSKMSNRITQFRHFQKWKSLSFTWNFITSLIKINHYVFWFYLLNQTQDQLILRFLNMYFLLKAS